MNKKLPVSVVISAYNEEKKIEDCLTSVAWADEIIVVDNESTDKTASLAKKHHAHVLTRPNNLMLNVNKNFGFSKAKHTWILSLDADERVSEELAEEIAIVVADESNDRNGYFIPRKNIIFGKWIRHTGWYPDYQLRLFRKNKGRFAEEHVHELITIDGEAGNLQENMIHLNHDSIAQFLHKTIIIYAPNEADQLMKKGYEFHYYDAIRFPLNEFLSRFFLREGYKDGFFGLVLSLLMACYHLIVFAFLWEKNGFKDQEPAELLQGLEHEIKKAQKDIRHWQTETAIKEVTSPIRKILIKVKRKLPIL